MYQKGTPKTNAQQVRQQNRQSAAGGAYQTEFATEAAGAAGAKTNAQQVRQQNQQSQSRKQQNQQ
jgi:small acid-soluble spore protein E (minor gamma-type SASP)